MRRIAICLYGLSNGFNSNGHKISFLTPIKKLVNQLQYQDIEYDFFYHTWLNDKINIDDLKSDLNNIIAPKLYVVENIKEFDKNKELNNLKSRWYSNDKSIKLAIDYSKVNQIEYDFLLVSRFDCYYENLFDFNNIKKRVIYVSNWQYPYNKFGCLDYWILLDFKFADYFSKISESLDSNFLKTNHFSSHNILKSISENNTRLYILEEHKDFYLYSRKYKKPRLHFRLKIIFRHLFNKYFKIQYNIWD